MPGLAYADNSAPATGKAAPTGAATANLKTFTSPAAKSIRLQKPATAGVKSRTATAGTTIYAYSTPFCSTDTGTGTQASPYCLVQDAVNAAVPGDTIDVIGSTGYFSEESVTVKTSGISIVGIGDQAWIQPTNAANHKPALILDGVSNVTVSNMMLTGNGAPAVEVIGSSGVTLDYDYADQFIGTTGANTIAIDGASSNVTVSRTYVDAGIWVAGSSGISVASGASHITLASDVFAASGITATGVSDLKIAGNTIQRACSSAVDVEGTSSGVSVQDNLLEDANPNTDYMLGGFPSKCAAAGQAWASDIAVAAGSSTATTVDYNDFYSYGSDATAPYHWAGTTYPTLAAFQAATAQGAHDTIDTQEAAANVYFRPNESANVDVRLRGGSAAIGSANPSAPGESSSDFYGTTPYTSRGAIEYANPNPTLAVGLSAKDTSAYGVTLSTDVTSAGLPLTASFAWGDGTTSSLSFTGSNTVAPAHTYAKLGKYPITVTVTDNSGDTVSNSVTVLTAGSDYTAYGPTRLLDTRSGAKVAAHAATRVLVAGNGGIPAGVTAAILNVTVTDATSAGFVTAYGDGDPRPSTSNVNFTAGQTVPNQVIVPVGLDGYVDLYNSSPSAVDLIADIAGYFTQSASSGYTPLTPDRLVDTRDGTGVAKGQVGGHASVAVQVAGKDGGGLPSSGITAVALNVTVTGPQSAGYLTVYPDGESTPLASNLNFSRGRTIANSVASPVGSDGRIRLYNGGSLPTDVVVDVVGYYSAAGKGGYLPIEPTRILDTRSSSWTYGPLVNGNYIYSPLSAGYPGITAFALNTTVTDTRGTGYLTVSPDSNSLSQYQNGTATMPGRPLVSTLNWVRGQTVPNLVQAGTGANGIIDFWNSGTGSIDLIIDAFGYYQND